MNELISTSKSDKTKAKVAGAFFIIATLSAVLGLKLYDPVLNNTNFLVLGAKHFNQIISGAIMELILACSAVGTGIMLYPFLKRYNESLGLAYVCFRVLEVVFILIGIVSVLSILTLSQAYTNSTNPDKDSFMIAGTIAKSMHDWTFILGPNFMLGVNTFIYSFVFYRSGLVPSKLAVLGIVGAVLIFIAALLEMFGIIDQISASGVLLALPIFFYEMILAFWLIMKGFNLNFDQKNV